MGRLGRILVAPKVRRQIERGSNMYNEGDVEGALECFTTAVELDEEHEEAHYYLALALMERKRHEEAEVHFRRSIDLKGNVSRTHADFAELLHHMGRKEEAEAEYRQALELDPSNAIAIMNLGTLLRDSGRFSEATELYNKAKDLPDLDEDSRKQLEEMLI
ncbi:MAG: tetratricopeptide repeat protein [Thermoplasmata archaeon]|nr:MAG: tetratricopeptide repeat protein [Thermoplasmata archaeon]